MMRVLVVSHTYTVGVNQRKLEAIAALGVELGLVVPKLWHDGLRTVPLERLNPGGQLRRAIRDRAQVQKLEGIKPRPNPVAYTDANSGERNARKIHQQMLDLIQTERLAEVDYISIADAETLDEFDIIKPPALVSMVVKFGRTRLLDNVVLK